MIASMEAEQAEAEGSGRSAAALGAPDACDEALIDAVRAGSAGAFAELYERYRPIAVASAQRYLSAHNRSQAEDVVEVTFSAVYDAMRRGGGPKGPFRPYLLLALRREAARHGRKRDRETIVDAVSAGNTVAAPQSETASGGPAPLSASAPVGSVDPSLLLGDAYGGLNPRFRNVLWLSEVEGYAPEELAPMLDLTPNAAAALTYRARNALRSGYFRAYSATLASATCKPLIGKLAEFVEAGQPSDGHATIRAHLEGCPACRDVLKGAMRSSTSLAALAPFGALSAGRWLDPRRPTQALAPRRRRERNLVVALVLLVLLIAGAAVAWPGGAPRTDSADGASSTADPAGAVPSPPPGAGATTTTGSPSTTTTAAPEEPPPARGPEAVPSTTTAPAAPGTGSIRIRLSIDPDGIGARAAGPGAALLIAVTDSRTGSTVRTTTDPAGRAAFDRVEPGSYRAQATVPVGLVPTGAAAPADGPGTRRTVDLGVVDVVAGEASTSELVLVPWRRLAVGAGAADTSASPGEPVGWDVSVDSLTGATSAVTVQAVLSVPVGTSVSEVRLERLDAAAAVCATAAEATGEITLRCRLARVDALTRLALDLEVSSTSGGTITASFTATADGFAVPDAATGPAVSLQP